MPKLDIKDILPKKRLHQLGYEVSEKGYTILLEPENLTKQTSGIISFKNRTIDIHKELGEMLERRGFKK